MPYKKIFLYKLKDALIKTNIDWTEKSFLAIFYSLPRKNPIKYDGTILIGRPYSFSENNNLEPVSF